MLDAVVKRLAITSSLGRLEGICPLSFFLANAKVGFIVQFILAFFSLCRP
jgi:hypothetical protein